MLSSVCGSAGSLSAVIYGSSWAALRSVGSSSRSFASLAQHAAAATASSTAAGAQGEVLALPDGAAGDATLLVTLPERPFSAFARLPQGLVQGLLQGAATSGVPPKRVAVLRPAFLPFDAQQPRLGQVVAPLGPSAVALAASSQLTHQRLLVDEYTLNSNTNSSSGSSSSGYSLSRPAAELASYLHNQRGLRLALVPDVAQAAAAASSNSVAAATQLRSMQSTNRVLMVAPTAFGFNEQAAQDNSFMHASQTPGEGSSLTAQVCREFSELHRQLTDVAGVQVSLFQHSLSHGTPDACFPNNWFSTHAAGEAAGGVAAPTLVLYPMKCPNRAAERRAEIVEVLCASGYGRVVDMAAHEQYDKKYFEGTGVLVLDRVNGVAYVALSERADKELAEQWVRSLGYKDLVTFRSYDKRGKPVYHTNVMMAIGTDVAVVCGESVTDDKERQHLLAKLRQTHTVVDISADQMDALCGNVLELQGGRGLPVLAMSTQAHNAFTPEQRAVLQRHVADLVHAPIDTLERVGGGGVRCALGELF